jgi:hypothetical protein
MQEYAQPSNTTRRLPHRNKRRREKKIRKKEEKTKEKEMGKGSGDKSL